MGYVLLWGEGMAVVLLGLALLARWAASRGGFFRKSVPILVFLVFASLAALTAHALAPWQREWGTQIPGELFVYVLSWLLVYVIAAGLLLRRAYQRTAPGLAGTAAGWSGKTLGLSLAGAALALGVTVWNLNLAARADLAAARQEAGDLLLTMTPPPVAEADSAAPVFRKAEKDLIASIRDPWRGAARNDRNAPRSEEVDWKDPYIVDLVGKQEKVLALLRKAVALPPDGLDYRSSLHDPQAWMGDRKRAELRIAELSLLTVDARVKAAQGNLGDAFDDVAALLNFTRHAPGMMAAPETLGPQFLAWGTLEDVLRLAPAAKEPLPSRSFPEVMSVLRVLHREVAVFGMIWPALIAEDPLRLPPTKELFRPFSQPPLVYLTEALVLPACRISLTPAELAYSQKKWDAYRRILRTPPEGTPQDWTALHTLIHEEPAGLFSVVYIKPKEKKLLRDAGQLAALGQLARAGLAAARYHDKHGKYPERLEQLVPAFLPAMPVDPRDGLGLRIIHFPEVTVLYTQHNSPTLDTERSWDPEKHKLEPTFRLYPRGKAK